MAELSRKAYEIIQKVAELIHEELESQIEPSPILFESNKLPNDISEKTFADALKYLSEEGLISYDSDTKSTAAFYKYDKQYKDALEVINSADYFINENKMRDKICKNINQYDNQRKAEAALYHITTFIVQPTLDFNEKYDEIMVKYAHYSKEEKTRTVHKMPVANSLTNFRLTYEVNGDSLQVLISGIVVRLASKSSFIGKIIMASIDASNSELSVFTNVNLKKIAPTYTRNTSAVINDFFNVSSLDDISNLSKAFLRRVPRTSKIFQIRTEVTAGELEDENINTELVRQELRVLAEKQI